MTERMCGDKIPSAVIESLKNFRKRVLTNPQTIEILLKISEPLLRYKLVGEENLRIAQEHLKKGSIFVVFNHLSFVDPFFLVRLLKQDLGDSMKRMVFPGAAKFQDDEWGLPSQIALAMAEIRGCEYFPIAQNRLSDQFTIKGLLDATKATRETLKKVGGVVCLAPEGTRSRTGTMGPAREGVIHFLPKEKEQREPVMFLPIGITGTENVHPVESDGRKLSLIVNPLAPVHIRVGELVRYQQIKNESQNFEIDPEDIVALHIAELLPPDYRGIYNEAPFASWWEAEN